MRSIAIALTLIVLSTVALSGRGAATGHETAAAPPPTVAPPRMEPHRAVRNVARSSNRFAWELYRALSRNQDTPNLFLSPSSIWTALAMTYVGASAVTAEQMSYVLHFDSPPEEVHAAIGALQLELTTGDDARVKIANRLWGADDRRFLDDFLGTIETDYGGGFETLDFRKDLESSRKRINAWVADHTNGKIDELIKPDVLTDDTALLLTNAVHFKADWLRQFDPAKTRKRPFWIDTFTSVTVEMMQAELVVPFLVDKDVMVAELPYAGERLSMVIILPVAREGLPGVEKQLDEKRVNKWLEALRPTTIDIALAKITLRGSTELGKRLAAMGMPDAFSRTDADFSGMTGTRNLYIDEVIHEAFVKLDEQGTEAAAATGVVMRPTSALPPRNPQFITDHPFLFFIRDSETGLVLFTGRLSKPDAAG